MDFSPTPRTLDIVSTARHFVRDELFPLEPALAKDGFPSLLPVLAEKRRLARQTGLFAAHMPEALGGAGLSLTEFAHLSEVLGGSPLGHYVFNCQAPDVGNMELLHSHGTPEQQARYLAPLVRGEIRSSFTMTEPEFPGSNPVWMGTTARLDGGEWVIRGHKWFTTGFEGSAFTVCMAVTDPDAPSHARASMLLVPTGTPGLELIGNLSIMGHRGGDWASHAEVSFQDARVPADALLGGEAARGQGFALAQHRLGPGRIHHCMRWIGVCERAFDLMCRHAVTRQIAPGRALGTKQIVQQWIAESRAEIHGARLMVLHAAWKIETAPDGTASSAREEIALIKFTVARTLQRVLDRAIQTLGGLGMTDDTPLAFWYAHTTAAYASSRAAGYLCSGASR